MHMVQYSTVQYSTDGNTGWLEELPLPVISAFGLRVRAVGEVLRGSRNPETLLLYSCLHKTMHDQQGLENMTLSPSAPPVSSLLDWSSGSAEQLART